MWVGGGGGELYQRGGRGAESLNPFSPRRGMPIVRPLHLCAAAACPPARMTLCSCRGLISSIGLMPVTFILPPIMWIRARRPGGAELALNCGIIASCSLIALLSFVGSLRNILVLAGEAGIL